MIFTKTMNARKIYTLVVIFGCITFGLALAGFAYTGTFTRYWADDYCYNAVLRVDGFWQGQRSFYQHTSDRYSVLPLVGISEVFGPSAIRFWPVLAVLLALVSLAWMLKQLAGFMGVHLHAAPRYLLAAMIVFFTLWQSPNLFQTLYWRTGMLTYFMPLIVNVFLLGIILHWTWCRVLKAWVVPLIFFLAFFAGGFSETTAALQAGAIGLALIATLVAVRLASRSNDKRRVGVQSLFMRRLTKFLVTALVGTLLAMVALFLSPSNSLRLVHMPEPAPLPVLVGLSLRFGFDFVVDTFSSQPLPTLVSFLAPMALGMASQAIYLSLPQPRRTGLALVAALLVTYLLIVSVCAPSVYVEVAYPEPRAIAAGRFVMVLGLAAAGWLSGSLVYGLLRRAGFLPVVMLAGSLALLALTSLYALRAARTIYFTDLPYYQQRAAGWDARDLEIRTLIQQGQRDVQVPALDSIAGLMELTPDPGRFPNTCITTAYGLRSITGFIE